MLLIKNDPKYNEQWPRALVPYKRIHGMDEPKRLAPLANDGKRSPHLPEGTPFGLVGTSSRSTSARAILAAASRRGRSRQRSPAATIHSRDWGASLTLGIAGNWFVQGADTCRYENSEIHAIRILATEPTTDPRYTGKGTAPLVERGQRTAAHPRRVPGAEVPSSLTLRVRETSRGA